MPLAKDELEFLFEDLESDRVERTISFRNTDKIREAICAFSNDLPAHNLPGVIIIGQQDDGLCANTPIEDQLLQKLGGLRCEGKILPLPHIQVERVTLKGCTVAVVIVEPSLRPPVRFDGRTWIRVGPRRAIASVEEERRLSEKQLWSNLPYDSRPFGGATLDDLDLFRFESEYLPASVSPLIIEQNGRSVEEKLRALRFISPQSVPVSAALLMIGKAPRDFFPGAYIQFIKIDGTSLTDPILDQKELSGTILDQVRLVDELIKLNIQTQTEIGETVRAEIFDYPYATLQQLIRNALLHRNYDGSHTPTKLYWFNDRVEIHNSGGLYGDVTPETIWKGATAYRNPLLAEGMKALGLVERFGFGLTKARDALEKNGSPPLKTDFSETFVAFIVGRRT